MDLHKIQNIQEKRFFVENRACGMKKMMKTALGGGPSGKHQSKSLIKKESGEEEYFDSTDEPQETNPIMPNNPFIDQEI